MKLIRAVLFDFAGTLYAYAEGNPVIDSELLREIVGDPDLSNDRASKACAEAVGVVYQSFLSRDYFTHREYFAEGFREALRRLMIEPRTELVEAYMLERTARASRRPLPPLRDGARETIRALRERGVVTGLVSNTDEGTFRRDLQSAALHETFHFYVSSEQVQSCKPHSRIFEEALRLSGTEPAETLFVGDSVDQDIAGANRMGMRSALICREDAVHRPRRHQPRHVIHRLSEILDLIDEASRITPGRSPLPSP